jgi:hypothetical protein
MLFKSSLPLFKVQRRRSATDFDKNSRIKSPCMEKSKMICMGHISGTYMYVNIEEKV